MKVFLIMVLINLFFVLNLQNKYKANKRLIISPNEKGKIEKSIIYSNVRLLKIRKTGEEDSSLNSDSDNTDLLDSESTDIFDEGKTPPQANITDPPSNYAKQKSDGLSNGAIVGIVIACVGVLIAVAALIFCLTRKPSVPPINPNSNNTIGVYNSSTRIN